MRHGRGISAILIALLCAPAFAAARTSPLPSNLLQQARTALFETNDLDLARAAAKSVLEQEPENAEALFVEMEAAALQADTAAQLDAALMLAQHHPTDPRAEIAAARILDLANNSVAFRRILPRVRALIAEGNPQSTYLRAAMIAAAADGAPGISLLHTAHEAGLLTDWRLAGPFGRLANLDFDRVWAPEREGLALPMVAGHAVESLRFDAGTFAVPSYFARSGVFYATTMAELPSAGSWYLRVESPGTVEVFVDGSSVLRKDDRFRATPEIAVRQLRLGRGAHRVMIKFLASAAPFRVALLPVAEPAHPAAHKNIGYTPEAAYVAAARSYWNGDYNGAIRGLSSLTASNIAIADYLAARAWSQVADESSEESDLLRKTLQAAPTAAAAETEAAQLAVAAEHPHDALIAIQHVLQERPQFAPAQELMAKLAGQLDWTSQAQKAIEAVLALHPSCDSLKDADSFFAAHEEFDRAAQVEQQLQSCSPASLAYVEALDRTGRHAEAARVAAAEVGAHPLRRASREAEVRELLLSGNSSGAKQAAQALAELAPNSRRYARAADNPEILLDNPEGSGFAGPNPFYAPWRRDGVAMVEKTRERQFSGGPAVQLLDDSVALQAADGSVSQYVHTVTRVLNRDGIERYGEADLPRDAELLELRTIKPDGTVAEPELTDKKSTVSMPGLAPGDAIDEEYVVHYPGGMEAHPEVFTHTFGSFHAPILYSRFVTLSEAPLQIDAQGIVPAPHEESWNGEHAWVWERNDIPQSEREVAQPQTGVLPAVRVLPALDRGWNDVRDQASDQMVDALRIGSRIEQTVATIAASGTDEAKARAIYRWVMANVQPGDDFNLLNLTSAEDALGSGAGSRTVTLLALARAAGLHADLLLARNPSSPQPRIPALNAYTRPVVLFHFGRHDVPVDAETDGLAFGALSPGVERNDALLVPVPSPAESAMEAAEWREPAIVSLPPVPTDEQSVATAEVHIDADGNLAADVHILLGSWRASQMRSILGDVDAAGRPDFFQQLAARIFPGVDESTGEVQYERDPDHPLEIQLHCRAPHAINMAGTEGQQTADLDQLVPTLGLKQMYSSAGSRLFPLFVDTPLVESATFRVHLPEGIQLLHPASGTRLHGEFGEYSVSFHMLAANTLEIRREFRIPVQVVPPDKIGAFRQFAEQIDTAERQRLTLSVYTTASTGAPGNAAMQPQN